VELRKQSAHSLHTHFTNRHQQHQLIIVTVSIAAVKGGAISMPDLHEFEELEAFEAPESPPEAPESLPEVPKPAPEGEDYNDLHNSAFTFVFGAVLAIIPLGLWAGVAVWMMIQVLRPGECVLTIDAGTIQGQDVNYDNTTTTTNDTSNSCNMGGVPLSVYDACFGMVTALIVAELAITPTGKDPSERLTQGADRAFRRVACGRLWQCIVTWLPACYMFVWFIIGLASLIVGGFIAEGTSGPLRATGMMWFGAIISSAYSYFWLADSGRRG
jgi:hypothetical protein